MDGDDTHVWLRVIDRGVGIPSEARHRIFELFEREQCHACRTLSIRRQARALDRQGTVQAVHTIVCTM